MNEFETDELRLLRQTRGATTELSDESLAVGRARLEREIRDRAEGGEPRRRRATAAQARRPGRRSRGALWVGAGVVAVGALVGTVIVATPAPILGPIAVEDPHAQAVELLERAADKALVDVEDVQPGQYLKVVSESEAISSQWDTGNMSSGIPEALVRSTSRQAFYYPYDSTHDVISRLDLAWKSEILYPLDDSVEARLIRDEIEQGQEVINGDQELPEFVEDSWDPSTMHVGGTPPSDIAELRAFILASETVTTPEQPELRNQIVLGRATAYVVDQSTPREVRAAALRLIADEADVHAESFAGSTVSDDGSGAGPSISIGAGTRIAFELRRGGTVKGEVVTTQELIFDESSARILGIRETLAKPSKEYPGVSAGSEISATSFTTSIVDEIPEVETWK